MSQRLVALVALAAFVVLVVGGFIAITMLSGGNDKASDKCSAAATVETRAA